MSTGDSRHPDIIAPPTNMSRLTNKKTWTTIITLGALSWIQPALAADIAANASGEITLDPSYRAIIKNNPSPPQDGFKFHLDVTEKPDTRAPAKYRTSADLFLLPPASLSANSSSAKALGGWEMCWNIFSGPKLQVGGDVDVNCKGVLQDDCLRALKQSADAGAGCERMPEECKATFDGSFGKETHLDYATKGVYSVDMDRLYNENGPYNHDQTDTSIYDKAVRQVFVGLASYAFNETEAKERNVSTGSITKLAGEITCLRVDKFSPGSRTRSSAADVREYSGILLLVAACLTAIAAAV